MFNVVIFSKQRAYQAAEAPMGHNLRAVDDKALLHLRVMHDINGLLKLLRFQMMMQIDPDVVGVIPLPERIKSGSLSCARRRCSDWLTAEGVI
jgi:hypothetical protein